jgi:hypothetical protein
VTLSCSDGSNVASVEDAELLLSTAEKVALRAAKEAPQAGEWAEPCGEGGTVSFRREVTDLVPEDAAAGEWGHYRANVTVSLDHCQEDGLLLTGVFVVETEQTEARTWFKYWGDLAEGSTQEFYCRFDAWVETGQSARGTICGFDSSEFALPELP